MVTPATNRIDLTTLSVIHNHLVNICREVQRKLRWDPKKEQFVGDEEANRLLNRPHRKGYELPRV